jgi:hypothetical protein
MDWILTSGFTQEEIAAIQEPFSRVNRPQEPAQPTIVDGDLRRTEDARLAKRYAEVDKMLVDNERASLDTAVDRLLRHQSLGWTLVDRTAPSFDGAAGRAQVPAID